jgi:hypothetical protein
VASSSGVIPRGELGVPQRHQLGERHGVEHDVLGIDVVELDERHSGVVAVGLLLL